MSTPALRAECLSFAIGGKLILDGVSFEVACGEYFAVIGPNGAGKSTLLKCINRIWQGATGSISLGGASLTSYSQRELAKIAAYVPQAGGRQFPFTARQFVMMGRYPHLSPFTSVQRADVRAVDEALELTGTRQFEDRLVPTLSGGERQKLYLAAAVAQGTSMLLLDEPTTFLDPKHRAEITDVLRRLNREKEITIVAVTHDINSAALEADRVLALKEGRAVFSGTPAELMTEPVLEMVFDKRFLLIEHPSRGTPIVIPDGIEGNRG
jgi:iron complex transport system ATP-binding protein